MKKRIRLVTLSLIFLLISMIGPFTSKIEAWGWHFHGGPVFDITRYIELIKEISQMEKQLTLMKADLDHLKEMDSSTSGLAKNYIVAAINRLITIRNTAKGLTYSYSQIQKQWDETFKDFGAFNGLKASDYANHLKTLDEKTSQALLDAMKAQGIIIDLDGDKVVLERLMDATKSAKGILGALQVTNYIAALQMTQLMRMELIITMSFRAQTTYYQWMMQEKMSQRAYADKNQIKFDNPTNSSSMGDGFPQF